MDTLRPALRAAAITAFVTGTVALLLQPPELSGAGGLLALLAGVVALVLVTAWLTVLLAGRQSLDEGEFERLVRRTEELAGQPHLAREATEFELLVAEAFDRLPDEFRRLLDETPVVVSQRRAEFGAYGHYFGDTFVRGTYPKRIVIYQDALERDFGHDPELLAQQVERTLRHELAHHIGWHEPGVRDLGL